KRIFRYLKGKPHLGLWSLKNSPFDLVAYSDIDYAGASLDMKSTTGGCQFLGVNTPRSDEDRLELLELKIFCFQEMKKVELNNARLMLLGHKTSVAVKKVNDVTRLQALVDKKKVVITEASIRDALCLDDAEVRNIDSPTKFCMYPRFIQLTIKKQVGDLSSHSTKYTSPALTQKVFANKRRVGKGFFGVDTPLFEGMLVAQEVGEDADEVHAKDVNVVGVVAKGAVVMMLMLMLMNHLFHYLHHLLHHHNHLKIYLPLPKYQQLHFRGIIANINADEDVVLEGAKNVAVEKFADVQKSADDQGRKAESQAEIYKIDLEHAKNVLNMQEEESEPAELQEVVEVVTTAKIITEFVTAATDTITAADVPILAATIDVAPTLTSAPSRRRKGRKQKEDKAVKRYQVLKRKPQTEAQAMKNMMIYLRNVAGLKMDYFKVVTAASDTITVANVLILAATIDVAPTLTAAPSRRRNGVVIRDPEETTTTSTIIHSEAKSKYKGKGILAEEPKPLKKQAQIKQDEKYARELAVELNKNIDWDEVIDHVQRKQKEDKAVKRYQALKRKPQTEAQARKNMMIYLRNVDGFKMDYFNGITYDDIRPIIKKHFDSNVAFQQKTKEQMDEEDSRALKRLNES
nr:uncharacterized mitochondrial protein AtMg00810-like [Tanacetum cinerariifolium]